jgi:hypothetical protein
MAKNLPTHIPILEKNYLFNWQNYPVIKSSVGGLIGHVPCLFFKIIIGNR